MAIGTFSPGNISISFDHIAACDARGASSIGSRGGRAGSRSTGDSSIRRRPIGTPQCQHSRIPTVGAQHAVPGTNSWRDERHPAESQAEGSANVHLECRSSHPPSSSEVSFVRSEATTDSESTSRQAGTANSGGKLPHSTCADAASRVVTYREYVTRRTPPRELAREIARRSVLAQSRGHRIRANASSHLPFARRIRAPHRRSLHRRTDGRRFRGRRPSAPHSRGRRPRRRLDADVPNARVGRVAAHRQLHRADSHAAESGARSGARSKTSRKWTATIPPTPRATA